MVMARQAARMILFYYAAYDDLAGVFCQLTLVVAKLVVIAALLGAEFRALRVVESAEVDWSILI